MLLALSVFGSLITIAKQWHDYADSKTTVILSEKVHAEKQDLLLEKGITCEQLAEIKSIVDHPTPENGTDFIKSYNLGKRGVLKIIYESYCQ